MKLGKLVRGTIETLYTDRFDAYRYEKRENEDGTTAQLLSKDPFIANMPCRISFVPNRQEDPKDRDVDSNPVITQPKLFSPPDCGLIVGDYVVARRIGDDGQVLATYTGPVGLPFAYPSHFECQIGVVTKA